MSYSGFLGAQVYQVMWLQTCARCAHDSPGMSLVAYSRSYSALLLHQIGVDASCSFWSRLMYYYSKLHNVHLKLHFRAACCLYKEVYPPLLRSDEAYRRYGDILTSNSETSSSHDFIHGDPFEPRARAVMNENAMVVFVVLAEMIAFIFS